MKFALFVAGAAMVSAQVCNGTTAATCTTAQNCSFYAGGCSVAFANQSFTCDTTSMTCGTHCAPGAVIKNYQTCSKCAPVCPTFTTETACDGDSICQFNNASCFAYTPQAPPRCSSTTKAACTAEENCFWADVSANVCNGNMGGGMCQSCNDTTPTLATRSAIKNMVGQTCTHAKAGSYAYSFAYTVHDYAQNAMCVATTAADATADKAGLLAAVNATFYGNTGLFDSASATATCAAAAPSESDASMLLPSAAFLALATLLA